MTTTLTLLTNKVFTPQIESFVKTIPHDWENISSDKQEEFRKDVSIHLLDILTEAEEVDSEAIACGKEPPSRSGVFNTDVDALNEIVRRLDCITEKKNYYGTYEEDENVQLIVKVCSFVSARAVALLHGRSSYTEDDDVEDDDDEDEDDLGGEEDLYDPLSTVSTLTETKCVEKILKWFRRIGREDTDRAEELCGYVQLFVSPDVDDEFITFKDKFLMSLFGVDLFDVGDDEVDDDFEDDEDEEDNDFEDEDEDDGTSE